MAWGPEPFPPTFLPCLRGRRDRGYRPDLPTGYGANEIGESGPRRRRPSWPGSTLGTTRSSRRGASTSPSGPWSGSAGPTASISRSSLRLRAIEARACSGGGGWCHPDVFTWEREFSPDNNPKVAPPTTTLAAAVPGQGRGPPPSRSARADQLASRSQRPERLGTLSREPRHAARSDRLNVTVMGPAASEIPRKPRAPGRAEASSGKRASAPPRQGQSAWAWRSESA